MENVQSQPTPRDTTPAARKPYIAPRMDAYGRVNELTRSGVPAIYIDGALTYGSVQGGA